MYVFALSAPLTLILPVDWSILILSVDKSYSVVSSDLYTLYENTGATESQIWVALNYVIWILDY